MKEQIKTIEKSEFAHREYQGIFSWWFSPKNSFSVIKIPVAIIFGFIFFDTLLLGLLNLVDAVRNEPLFTGVMILIFFPLIITFFIGAILWGGLFYLPYHVFEEEKGNWKMLLKYIGMLIGVSLLGAFINILIFGWAYSPF